MRTSRTVIVHGLLEVDGIQRFDDIPVLFQHLSAFNQDCPFRLLSIRNKKKVSSFQSVTLSLSFSISRTTLSVKVSRLVLLKWI